MIPALTDLRPLLIALVEGLEVLDLDPVLQRGEVKVGQAVHRPPPGLVLVVDGGETPARGRGEDAHSRRKSQVTLSMRVPHVAAHKKQITH